MTYESLSHETESEVPAAASRLAKVVLPLASFVIVMLVWEATVRMGWVATYILPAPSSVVLKIQTLWKVLAYHTYVTAVEIALGFLLAAVLGVILGLAMVYISWFELIIYPWIIVSQVVPKVAIAPLFIIWLGFGELPKVVIAFLIAFFPILVDTLVGLRSVEQEPVFLLKSMGAGRLRTFWYVRLPTALPNIFAGLRVGVTLATVGAIIGEFVGANEGLGYLLLFANGIIDTQLLFAALAILSALALVFYWIVLLVERMVIPWHVSVRTESIVGTL
jgi:NitT/TauT family transport system permease protein